MILIFILEWGTFSSMNKVQKYMKIRIQEFAFSVEKNRRIMLSLVVLPVLNSFCHAFLIFRTTYFQYSVPLITIFCMVFINNSYFNHAEVIKYTK